ncbi:MAG: hypothetical protein COU46_02280 [Candidatus Niyogibacteria bacterium CG10_big_fil_rev_8_21_14_0_10_42_19]|uniref:Uncharacterized protein n=1 Tax=Candidatus Niyogibacteria bacterium CG10_big_fil_rev_8_21_14_0_10_42_19 TaxID=1974725 RepID=A0A2H0TH43_9BACT|nr:MAG: hypothetical protein COU46_02280 [Candidatus Niyogibacteria bacterium CG10_big_fil_rev_8_21_14_0_10_42_19]
MARQGGGGQQKKNIGGGHKTNKAAQKKRATYVSRGGSVRNRMRRIKRDARNKLPEVVERRRAKKAAAAAKPENREHRRMAKELRKKRQAARRGNLEVLRDLERNDVPVRDIKSEAHFAARALKGDRKAFGVLEECYPETAKAIKKKISDEQKEVEAKVKKSLSEADDVIKDVNAEAEAQKELSEE